MTQPTADDESESDDDSPHAADKFDWSLAGGLEIGRPRSIKEAIQEALNGAQHDQDA